MFKMPDKVRIAGNDYEVVLKDIDKNECDGNVVGYFDARRRKITIDTGTESQLQESSLIHEMLEAINHHYELTLEHNVIKILESALYQVLKDNKMLNNQCDCGKEPRHSEEKLNKTSEMAMDA